MKVLTLWLISSELGKSGGCSGLSYELKFDKLKLDDDKIYTDNSVRILVDKKVYYA